MKMDGKFVWKTVGYRLFCFLLKKMYCRMFTITVYNNYKSFLIMKNVASRFCFLKARKVYYIEFKATSLYYIVCNFMCVKTRCLSKFKYFSEEHLLP